MCLTAERWMGLRVQSTVGSFPAVMLVFRDASTCGVAKAIYKKH